MSDLVQLMGDAFQWGVSRERYAALLPAFQQALHEMDCTSVERVAMVIAQTGHESGGLKWMEEIADGSAYNNRADLANGPTDGPTFKGRGALMVTGRGHYTNLSQWAHSEGLVPTPMFFVEHPEELASDKYCFTGLTWYWVTQRPLNDASDARDVERATRYVNGGLNGLSDRTQRYNHAMSMGDRLLELTADGKETVLVASTQTLVGEKVLKYNDQIVAQETYYNCGPASTQVALSCRGIWESEAELARQLGTDTGGTDWIGLFPPVLNSYMPDGKYTHTDIPNDPPTASQKSHFWNALKNGIDAGYALVGNIVAPPGNYPIGVKGSPTLSYRSGTYYHYVCFVGYDDTYPGGAVRWADPGFSPYWSWVSLDQTVSLIAGKGFAYPTVKAPETPPPDPIIGGNVSLTPEQDRMLKEIWGALFNKVSSTSYYAPASEGAIYPSKDFWRYSDGHIHTMFCEHRALLGDKYAMDFIYNKKMEGDAFAAHIWDLIPQEYKDHPIS